MPGVVHADAGTFDVTDGFGGSGLGDIKIVAQEIVAIQAAIYMHGAAEQAGTLGAALKIFHRLDGA